MARKNGNSLNPDSGAARFLAALLALLVWQLAAIWMDNRLLLVGPVEVAARLARLIFQRSFWGALGFTFSRITGGFFLGFFLALGLAAVSARFPLAHTLLRPYLLAVQTVPVASFIVIALLWLSGRRLSIFISFLMVLPVLYANSLQGLRSADAQLLEMARVFRIPLSRRIACIYAPALRQHLLPACHVALGLCWKAGVAAEVIGVTGGSIGGMLYDAKVYLEIGDLFAWTLVIVGISVAFEKVFTLLLNRLLVWMEESAWTLF